MTQQATILNLDDILAEQPKRTIIWQGQEHEVVGLTGEAYLKFLRARKGLDEAQKKGDEAAQWEQNIAIIGIVVPTLAAKKVDLLALRLPVLDKLTKYIMAEFSEAALGAGELTTTGSAAEAGE